MLFRGTLQKFLEPHYTIAGSVGDGLALLEAARALDPDVIIADISMPVLNGIQAVRQLMSAQPDARVIFVTVHEEPAFVMEGQRSGALGYLLKRDVANQLIPAIREVLQGNPFICPGLLNEIRPYLAPKLKIPSELEKLRVDKLSAYK